MVAGLRPLCPAGIALGYEFGDRAIAMETTPSSGLASLGHLLPGGEKSAEAGLMHVARKCAAVSGQRHA